MNIFPISLNTLVQKYDVGKVYKVVKLSSCFAL